MRPAVFMAALGVALVAPVAVAPNLLPALDRALRRFSDASNAFIVRTLTPAKADNAPIDAKAAANLDEDIDWRIASQSKTGKGWRDFLAAHPIGKHAPLAQAALAALEPMPMPKPVPKPAPKPQPAPAPPLPPAALTRTPSAPSPSRFVPLVEVGNETPRLPDYFAALERQPPEAKVETVVKWREETRTVTRWRFARPRHTRVRRPPPPFFLSWFGPRAPYPDR